MISEIYALFDKLDEELRPLAAGEHLDIYLLGRAAMVLSYNVLLSTKDIDIVSWQKSRLEQRAIEISGRESRLARSLGLYLDPVPPGLPPVPTGFEQHCTSLPGNVKTFNCFAIEGY